MNATSSATSSSRLKTGRSGTCEPVTSRRVAEMIRLQRVFFAACLACSAALSIVGVTPEKSRRDDESTPSTATYKEAAGSRFRQRSAKNCLRHVAHPISASRVLPAFSSPSQGFGWFRHAQANCGADTKNGCLRNGSSRRGTISTARSTKPQPVN